MPSDSYWELEKDGFTSTNRADAMNKDEVFSVNEARNGVELVTSNNFDKTCLLPHVSYLTPIYVLYGRKKALTCIYYIRGLASQ